MLIIVRNKFHKCRRYAALILTKTNFSTILPVRCTYLKIKPHSGNSMVEKILMHDGKSRIAATVYCLSCNY